MMDRSTFGTMFRVTTWGESHGKALGVVVDGCPAGLSLCEADIQEYLDRRKPGRDRYASARKEEDRVEILSGVFEGRTTGTPISLMIRNMDQRSADYGNLAETYRPGHADYCYDQKYGFRDYRGGGRSSARETVGRVAAGAIAAKLLAQLGVSFESCVTAIGPVLAEQYDPEEIGRNPLCMPDADAAERAAAYLEQCMEERDSSGGCVECRIHGVPKGLGEPVFQKLDAVLAGGILSIGAVKAVEIGDGVRVSGMRGSENNDSFRCVDGEVRKESNHAGGILGGISDGSEILVRASLKPTPSVSGPQSTVNRMGENVQLEIHGRHDPVVAPRAVVVVESMCALALADLLLLNMTSRMDRIVKFYQLGSRNPV